MTVIPFIRKGQLPKDICAKCFRPLGEQIHVEFTKAGLVPYCYECWEQIKREKGERNEIQKKTSCD